MTRFYFCKKGTDLIKSGQIQFKRGQTLLCKKILSANTQNKISSKMMSVPF